MLRLSETMTPLRDASIRKRSAASAGGKYFGKKLPTHCKYNLCISAATKARTGGTIS